MKTKKKVGRKPGAPGALYRLRKHFPQLTSVVDAVAPLEVIVRPSDNKKGISFTPTECALARACKRQFKVSGAIVNLSFSYLINGTQAIRFSNNETIRREVVTFDRHKAFLPGIYYLRPPAPALRLGAARAHVLQNGPSRGKQKHFVHKTTTRNVRHFV